MTEPFNVMLSSAGRRVALLRIFRRTLRELGLPGKVLAVDESPISAAFHEADQAWTVPHCTSSEFVPRLLDICRTHDVRCIVPTIDPELPVYAAHRSEFAAQGTTVLVSAPEVIAISNDKRAFHAWLVKQRFPTVQQWDLDQFLKDRPARATFPLIAKPRNGSSSIGLHWVRNWEDLDGIGTKSGYILQTVAPGREYTVDVLVGRQGHCLCAVPRKRLETRAGEVNKGVTERREDLIDLASRIAEALLGAYGVMNIQIFWDETSRAMNVIEVNPRFGGGFPLTWEAGAHYPRWLIEEILGRPATSARNDWIDGLTMLRFDDAIFIPARKAGK